MTTAQLMAIVAERGLSIALKDGRPVLQQCAGKPEVTAELLAVLKFHREKIIEILKKQG
jgi:hypothetical protein